MLPLKWLVRSSVGRPDDVEEHNLAFELFGYSLNQICGNDRIRAIQVTALVSMDAGSEASASGSQHPGQGSLEPAACPASNPRSVETAEQK